MDKISEKLIEVTFGLGEKVSASSKEVAISIRDLVNESQRNRDLIIDTNKGMQLLIEHCKRQDPEWLREELRKQRADAEGLKRILAFFRDMGAGIMAMGGQLVKNKLFWLVLILILLMKSPNPVELAKALKILIGANYAEQNTHSISK